MKRFLSALLICTILLSFGYALKASELQTIAFPFIGRWQPSEDPVLIDDYGLQDIQNLRKSGKHFKGISGHTIINSTSVSAAPAFLNGFHFRKDQPQESHVLVLAGNSTAPTASAVYQNTTAIPSTGLFSATTVYTDASGGIGSGRFSIAPAGNMVYANGPETVVWGGSEIEAAAFITSENSLTGTSFSLTNPIDYSDAVRNTKTDADQIAIVGGGIDSSVKLLLHGDGTDGSTTITDSSSGGIATSAVSNVVLDTDQKEFGSASILFTSASSSFVSWADSADWFYDTDKFTIDFWIRFNSLPAVGTRDGLFGQYQDGANWIIFQIGNNGSYYIYVESDIGGVQTNHMAKNIWASPEGGLRTGVWYHFAIIRGWGGGANSWMLAINGVASQTVTTSASSLPDIAATFDLGRAQSGDLLSERFYLDGWIDEFRISKGVARWTSNFSPPARAYATDQNFWLVGFTRPLQGVKFYVESPNTETSTMTAKEWNGSSWTSIAITDNTASGGISLAQTGTVTFTSTVRTSKPRYIAGNSLYWYQFGIDAGSATIYYATVDAPIQSIKNVWDGGKYYTTKALVYDGTKYIDYTDAVNDQVTTTYLDASALSTAAYILFGFTQPQQAFEIEMLAGSENTTSSTSSTASYWNGSSWVTVLSPSDGTAISTTALNKSGVLAFNPVDAGTEFPKSIGDETPIYYYKLAYAASLGSAVKISEVRGYPAPKPIGTYRFSETFQNRLFLFNEYNGDKNKAIYSMENTADIFNGSDSGELFFGDKTEITAAVNVYNVLGNSAVDQLIVTKKNETYRVSGDSPESWVVKRISAIVGCVAPLSMAAVEISGGKDDDSRKQVVVWQGDKGFYMTDGSLVVPISDDIRCYFDPNDSRYIPTARRSKTVGWYDPALRVYKALISSGSGQAYHNIELEYSLAHQEWTKIYRASATGADPLQSGFQVFDTDGIGYTYGGNLTGNMYRLENGGTFNGTNITQYLQTKDLILDATAPLFRQSTVKYLRTAHKKKTAGGSVQIAHYGDQILTVSGQSNQVVPSAFSIATSPYDTQSCDIGPFLYHSFKFTVSDTTVADGMELIGLGLWVEPQTVIR